MPPNADVKVQKGAMSNRAAKGVPSITITPKRNGADETIICNNKEIDIATSSLRFLSEVKPAQLEVFSSLCSAALALGAHTLESTSKPAPDEEEEHDKSPKSKHSPSERLQRSRERNRMHARKTRQRKKEQMQRLQERADELKEEQIRLRQTINEKNTANILVGLFSTDDKKASTAEDPKIEGLLLRPLNEIPSASQIPELPALILPGQNKKVQGNACPDDGIDYDLLCKDRSTCSQSELDQIRRERNRMHAKRTRDRKRIFMEEMEVMIKQLEDENEILQGHLESLGGDGPPSPPPLISPEMTPDSPPQETVPEAPLDASSKRTRETPEQRKELVKQLKSLLVAAGAFEQPTTCDNQGMTAMSSAATAISASTDVSGNSSCCEGHEPTAKRQKLEASVPQTITTTAPAIRA